MACMGNTTIPYDHLILIKPETRIIFLCVFALATSVSLACNIAAIYTITKRNYRCLQKTCIISLAVSDILGTAAIATINITNLSTDVFIWFLGSFLCRFLPMCQMTAVLASSLALVFIAMDRYQNVVSALTKRMDPESCTCLTIAAFLWLISFSASYPMYTYYDTASMCVMHHNAREEFQVCFLTVEKYSLRKYTIAMVVIIFLPLLVVFLWFYYNIASLVWKHRRPVSQTQNHIRVEKKIRTFKIIVTLMVVFIICRLPYFVIGVIKTMDSGPITDANITWNLSFTFMVLHIVNCLANPLLYTFLNSSLQAWFGLKKSVKELCCLGFESFEKENPFVVECYDNKKSRVRFEQ